MQLDDTTTHMVTDAITDLRRCGPRDGSTGSAVMARHRRVLTRLAYLAYQHGVSRTLLGLCDTRQAAAELGISIRRVQHLAKARGLGWRTTSGRDIIFRPEDIENMRTRIPGRPPGRDGARTTRSSLR